MVVLDTDHVSLLQLGEGAPARRLLDRVTKLEPGAVGTTIVTYEEQMRGWMAYLSKGRTMSHLVTGYGRLGRHLEYFSSIPVLPFDDRAAVEHQRLVGSRMRIGTMDLRIAAIVLVHGTKLLTRNVRHFRGIPGLLVEDWTQ